MRHEPLHVESAAGVPIAGQHRSTEYYQSRKDPPTNLRLRMKELAQTRVRYCYRRLHVLLRREGSTLGKSLAYGLYAEEALQLRKRPVTTVSSR